MSRKPKKAEEDDIVDPILDEGEDDDNDDLVEPEDTAEIDFDRKRSRDWDDVDDLMEDNDY